MQPDPWQGPLFEKSNRKVIKGYVEHFLLVFSGPSNTNCERIKANRLEIEDYFKNLSGFVGLPEPWVVSSSDLASKLLYKCEMKGVLVETTLPSVGISLGIAFIVVFVVTRNVKGALSSILVICTIILTTMGILALIHWELNIVEAIIITLGVGLSFDFTLHFAVAYTTELDHQRTSYGDDIISTRELVNGMFQEAVVPILLSAVSTFWGGFMFCFADSYPFFQIGLFMVIITLVSLFGSAVLFISLVACVEEIIQKISRKYRYRQMNTDIYQQHLVVQFLNQYNLDELHQMQQLIKPGTISVYLGGKL